jgi:hypothetical protein
MFQQQINGNLTVHSPFVTADGWVWFCGTNYGLNRVFNDGSQQSLPGSNKTFNVPVVTANGWVWFQGTDNQLYRMKTDGSQRWTLGPAWPISSPPALSPTGSQVWFMGTKNQLFYINTYDVDSGGVAVYQPGDNSTKDRPGFFPGGTYDPYYVWFQGANNGLYCMEANGDQLSTPGNNWTKSMPVVTADGWVWFQGTDSKLYRMRTDGSQRSTPGNVRDNVCESGRAAACVLVTFVARRREIFGAIWQTTLTHRRAGAPPPAARPRPGSGSARRTWRWRPRRR